MDPSEQIINIESTKVTGKKIIKCDVHLLNVCNVITECIYSYLQRPAGSRRVMLVIMVTSYLNFCIPQGQGGGVAVTTQSNLLISPRFICCYMSVEFLTLDVSYLMTKRERNQSRLLCYV